MYAPKLTITTFIFLFCVFLNGAVAQGSEQIPLSTTTLYSVSALTKAEASSAWDFLNSKSNKITEEKRIKSDTNQSKLKLKTARNSITFQPIGLFLLLSNIEYDRAVSKKISIGGKISFTTFFLRNAVANLVKGSDDKTAIKSFSSVGLGSHVRLFTGSRPVEGFFLGLDIAGIFFKYDKEENDPNTGETTKTNHPGSLWTTEFEIGVTNKMSKGQQGFTLQWTVGIGAGFGNYNNESITIPVGSLGIGIGYSF